MQDSNLRPTLAGLDQVQWQSLTHAYGKAIDTPRHLQALLSNDEKTRGNALCELEISICHAGYQISEASLAALPFLFELVAWPALPQRAEIVGLIADIANGNGWFQGAGRFEFVEKDFGHEEIQHQVRKEEELQARIAKAVNRYKSTCFALLEDDDEDVIYETLWILAVVKEFEQGKEFDEKLGELLRRCLQCLKSPFIHASVLLALAVVGGDEVVQILHDALYSNSSNLVRVAAATGLLHHKVPLEDKVWELLLSTINETNYIARELEGNPFSPFSSLSMFICFNLKENHSDWSKKLLEDLVERASNHTYISKFRAASIFLLAANTEKPWFVQDNLTLLQRRAIEVVTCTAPEQSFSKSEADYRRRKLIDVLHSFDLPTDLNELRRFLSYEITTPGIEGDE